MKADLPNNLVEDVAIAVVLMGETPEVKNWTVYVVNLKSIPITNVMITSKGYGEKDGKQVKTSLLRHFRSGCKFFCGCRSNRHTGFWFNK